MSSAVSYLKVVVAIVALLLAAGLLAGLFVTTGVIPPKTTTVITSSTLTAPTTLIAPTTVTSTLTTRLTSVHTATRIIEHSYTTTQVATITLTTTKPLLPVDYKAMILFHINPTTRDDSAIWVVNETAIGVRLEVAVLEASWPSMDRRIKSLEIRGPSDFYVNLTEGDFTMTPINEDYTDIHGLIDRPPTLPPVPFFYIDTILLAKPSQVVVGGEYFVRLLIQREDGSVIHADLWFRDWQAESGSWSYEEWHLIAPPLLEEKPP